jgi:alkyl sulfatase BDS1-like metallo-beta-lactamase superfamily hydrolase
VRFAIPYLASLERVIALEPEILVPSHFEPIRGAGKIREGLVRTRDAVRYLHDATVAGMNEGEDLYTLMREIRLPKELDLPESHGKVSWNVRAIWEGYSGWFHFESTPQLYPVPPSSVYREVVELAGGADAFAQRAKARVGRGEPVEALHLVEMALAAQPDHRAALEARLAALELLLERSGGENHSELFWLRHRIAATRTRLGG